MNTLQNIGGSNLGCPHSCPHFATNFSRKRLWLKLRTNLPINNRLCHTFIVEKTLLQLSYLVNGLPFKGFEKLSGGQQPPPLGPPWSSLGFTLKRAYSFLTCTKRIARFPLPQVFWHPYVKK